MHNIYRMPWVEKRDFQTLKAIALCDQVKLLSFRFEN